VSKFDFMFFHDGCYVTDIVAPKSKYTKEEFLETALLECDGYDFSDEVREENIREKYVRWYPIPPEDCDYDGDKGCYTFGKPGRGAIPVWAINVR